ncbi:MAG: D-alanyl-D-alanine carboxypeptidase/D-alanyl-D-alanine-endopeptidase [Pyrinomonadaceae bacterium]|nr:D-alanyl-D-alanine carboxypeptidase/D-alanyl-D-alanine-endopeptidase [Pyrinomonadaceae bacterium]
MKRIKALLLLTLLLVLPIKAQQDASRFRVITSPTPQKSFENDSRQNLTELQSKIREILTRDYLRRSRLGIKILSLDTGKVIFEEDSEKLFMPASNMKNFTVAAAIEKLTPNFTFVTSVYSSTKPDKDGILHSDLIIYGRGDPTISFGISSDDEINAMEKLADKIVSLGIKKIKGKLIGDESFFTGTKIPYTWEWEDLQWYYGAQVSALTINDNVAKLFIIPSMNEGEQAKIQVLPVESGLFLINKVETSKAGVPRKINITRKLGTNIVQVTGSIPKDDKGYEAFVSIPDPALTFTSILRSILERKGVIIEGQTETADAETRKQQPLPKDLVELTRLESPPLFLIAQKTMKPSQNLYTEILLRTLGENVPTESAKPEWTSSDKGIAVIDKFLQEIGIPQGSVLMYDGSGLSRHNLVTPNAVVSLYAFMHKSRFSQAWTESLTIGGVDGTLKNRFRGTKAENNVRGKTGTISQVSSLSGYVTTAAGERLAFSIIVNNFPDQNLRVSVIDEIVLLLANFNGRLN